jgi:hypothetical protein
MCVTQGTQISLVYIHQCLSHPPVPRKDKAYRKFLPGTVPGESSVSEVDSVDDIDESFCREWCQGRVLYQRLTRMTILTKVSAGNGARGEFCVRG